MHWGFFPFHRIQQTRKPKKIEKQIIIFKKKRRTNATRDVPFGISVDQTITMNELDINNLPLIEYMFETIRHIGKKLHFCNRNTNRSFRYI